jgi:NAD(P)H dehydrogenase (quinone)
MPATRWIARRVKVLLVLAHAEPKSFCGALYQTALETLAGAGHDIRTSDLYGMGFDPVGDRRDFQVAANGDFFKYQKEQLAAVAGHGFVPALQAEMDKLVWCDLVIFCFPLWWFGLPAILKGWFDRVLALGFAYGSGRWFETGPLFGRRALLAMTAGAPECRYQDGAIFGGIERVLYPIHVGILNLTGFAVHEPFIAWSPVRIDDAARAAVLARWRGRLLGLGSEAALPMHTVADHPDPYAGVA